MPRWDGPRRDGGQPLYQQVEQYIIQLISAGRLGPGDELVSVRRLSQDIGVASATVQRAYLRLKTRGYVVARPGRGLFVADFTLGADQRHDDRSLASLLRTAAREALASGHARTAVQRALLQLAEEYGPARGQTTSVVFVARTLQIAAEYEPVLADSLSDLCDVSSILLDSLTEEFVRRLESESGRTLLVTLIPSLDLVAAFARSIGVDAAGLVIELTPASQEALLNLDHSLGLLVVAERDFVSPSVAMVRNYVGPERPVAGMAVSAKELPGAITAAPVVICSASAAPTVRALSDDRHRVIELRYRPTTVAIERLRRVVSAPVRQEAERLETIAAENRRLRRTSP